MIALLFGKSRKEPSAKPSSKNLCLLRRWVARWETLWTSDLPAYGGAGFYCSPLLKSNDSYSRNPPWHCNPARNRRSAD